MELGENYWGGRLSEQPSGTKSSETPKAVEANGPEAITEADRVRARVAVSRGEAMTYILTAPPCDFSDLETHPAGGDVYEIVHNGTVFGYTRDKNAFGIKEANINYQ